MENIDRRDFIKTTAGTAALGTLGFNIKKYPNSPNDTIRVAIVGLHGQGNAHIMAYSRMPNVQIAALCDVDQSVLNKRCQEVENISKQKPMVFSDIRKLLEDKTIDAISIATPNHWHSLMGIWACQAGKDVYVE
ncbi:MAG: Gfo/Idh/MocA family oxidoreductase [Blastocatellia bacterium]|nr:Gfo/Idh/MocA family oxidoreductase [Blastocatellia bacterium]